MSLASVCCVRGMRAAASARNGEDGIWLGRRWGSITHIAATGPGEVCEVCAVACKPLSELWSREELQDLRATPWAWDAPREAAAEGVEVIPHAPAAAGAIPVSPEPKGQVAPMRVNITPAILEEYGYTAGCRRCTVLRTGRAAMGGQAHGAVPGLHRKATTGRRAWQHGPGRRQSR